MPPETQHSEAAGQSADRRSLLENHLSFFETHRGTVRRNPSAIEIHSQSKEFTFAYLEEGPDTKVLEQHPAVRLTPWSRGWSEELSRRQYKEQGALVYMALTGVTPTRAAPSELRIEIARTEDQLRTFSDVQTRGFLSQGASYEQWFAFLHAANLRNLENPSQIFYVAYRDREPVGVTLLLLSSGVAGIYAVATLPSQRKQGISSGLLNRAIADGRSRGFDTIALQVAQGSYAERLYTHLGFAPMFLTPMLSRQG